MIYHCVKCSTDIARLALEYHKLQKLEILNSSFNSQKLILDSIKSYTALIDQNVQSLMHMYFNSAYKNLDYALIASADNRKSYLLQARNSFIDATSFERNENLILSYMGLALCQVLTNDMRNSLISLQKVKNVIFSLPDKNTEGLLGMPYEAEVLALWGVNVIKSLFDSLSQNKLPKELDTSIVKQYYNRFCNYLKKMNFSLYVPEKEIEKKVLLVEQMIMEEDFESFKSDIIVQFGL